MAPDGSGEQHVTPVMEWAPAGVWWGERSANHHIHNCGPTLGNAVKEDIVGNHSANLYATRQAGEGYGVVLPTNSVISVGDLVVDIVVEVEIASKGRIPSSPSPLAWWPGEFDTPNMLLSLTDEAQLSCSASHMLPNCTCATMDMHGRDGLGFDTLTKLHLVPFFVQFTHCLATGWKKDGWISSWPYDVQDADCVRKVSETIWKSPITKSITKVFFFNELNCVNCGAPLPQHEIVRTCCSLARWSGWECYQATLLRVHPFGGSSNSRIMYIMYRLDRAKMLAPLTWERPASLSLLETSVAVVGAYEAKHMPLN